MSVVSMTTASFATVNGDAVRVLSDWSRAASASATAAWPRWLPAWALSLARRRARS